MNTESDLVANSSQGGRNQSSKNVAEKYDDPGQRGDNSDYSLDDMDDARDDGDDDGTAAGGVRSVVAFVKENKEIWQ